MDEDEERVKIIFVGDTDVGKTSIVTRIRDNSFYENTKPTIGMDLLLKEVDLKDRKRFPVVIWDTAGQERFRGMAPFYYKGAKCVIVVFDVTNRKTYLSVNKWKNELKNFCDIEPIMFLIGNKNESIENRDVPPEGEMESISKIWGFAGYYEISALGNPNRHIQDVFTEIVEACYKREDWKPNESPLSKYATEGSDAISIVEVGKKSGGCC